MSLSILETHEICKSRGDSVHLKLMRFISQQETVYSKLMFVWSCVEPSRPDRAAVIFLSCMQTVCVTGEPGQHLAGVNRELNNRGRASDVTLMKWYDEHDKVRSANNLSRQKRLPVSSLNQTQRGWLSEVVCQRFSSGADGAVRGFPRELMVLS
ncbi:hypothetical protein RRG08_008124 [Elysia crispata]|uniref:Uncharacterized protein n=1 Tax=Elysia crispata TaxID=231223 RepID=A0AAE0XS49_9GAST|nr:hypothetical protein RRG08_008124 [Elysia crispata]